MALTTTTKIELVSDLTTNDISTENLALMIAEAERQFWKDISVREEWQIPDGNIDGSNREYRTQTYPISPTGSATVTSTSDIKIYGIHQNTTTGFDESTVLTVSTVYANDGRFKLSTAPDNATYDELRMNYSYTGFDLDSDKISLAVAYLTAFLVYGGNFTTGEYQNVKFKDVSISQGTKSADNKSKAISMYQNYNNTIRSFLPRRFRDTKIRSRSFIESELKVSRRATKFGQFQTQSAPRLSK